MNAPVDLEAVQRELEQQSIDLGIQRYNRRLDTEGEESMPPGLRLMRTLVVGQEGCVGLSKMIEEALEVASRGTPGPAAAVYHYLRQFTPEEAAVVTVRQALHAMSRRMSVQQASLAVAKALEASINVAELAKQNAGLYRAYVRVAKKAKGQHSRIVLLKKQQQYAGVQAVRWGLAEKVKLGHFLLTMLVDCEPKIIQFATSQTEFGQPGPLVIEPTVWAQEWLQESHQRCSILSPIYKPMVVPPKPWTGPVGGGYLTKGLHYALVKKTRAGVLSALKKHHMPKVYAAVNALQETPWAVNKAVLSVASEMWQAGGGQAGLPSQENLPLPARNFEDGVEKDDPRLVDWKRRASKVYERNAQMVSKRLSVMCQLDLATEMSKFGQIYFPHALDWRGRAYPVPSHLTPQSNDLGKALLQFADGCPLGENGAFWLAVHGSNCAGVDKVSYDERVQWVQDHEEDIVAAAVDPYHTLAFWGSVDAPWQFLAFCKEWAGVVMWHRAGKPLAEYVSHLPVGLDGSCNGLQQFSALLRDEVGGAATNLIPSDKPSDIYAAVATVAQQIIDEKAATGDEQAQRWVGRITRKITKRNTMTVPYGVTQLGMRDQLWAEFRKMRDDALEAGRDASEWEVSSADCLFLAQVNHQAIGQVVIAARAAMDWLKDVAKVAAATGKAIRWVTPSGMLVVQDYREMIGQRVNTYMTGTRQQFTLTVEGNKLDKRRMGLGISPNFVHSLDASHLHNTVVACTERGLVSLAMIHDSYGTHAGKIDLLATTLRETFVEQYSGDVLADYRKQLEEQLPEELVKELPPLPPMGNLEVAQVLNSDYFFA